MKKNIKHSSPILNHINVNEVEEFSKKYFYIYDIIRELDENYKVGQIYKSIRKIIGKENFCANYSNRLYFWEFTSESGINYYLIASKKGLSLEIINVDFKNKNGLIVLNDFIKKLERKNYEQI